VRLLLDFYLPGFPMELLLDCHDTGGLMKGKLFFSLMDAPWNPSLISIYLFLVAPMNPPRFLHSWKYQELLLDFIYTRCHRESPWISMFPDTAWKSYAIHKFLDVTWNSSGIYKFLDVTWNSSWIFMFLIGTLNFQVR
jgi:hypothetical protein